MQKEPKDYAIKEADQMLSDKDVEAIILAIAAGHPEGIDEPLLIKTAERVQKLIIKTIVDYAIWDLIKQGKVSIAKASDDDMTIRILDKDSYIGK